MLSSQCCILQSIKGAPHAFLPGLVLNKIYSRLVGACLYISSLHSVSVSECLFEKCTKKKGSSGYIAYRVASLDCPMRKVLAGHVDCYRTGGTSMRKAAKIGLEHRDNTSGLLYSSSSKALGVPAMSVMESSEQPASWLHDVPHSTHNAE